MLGCLAALPLAAAPPTPPQPQDAAPPYAGPPPDARARLDRILSRREFRANYAESPWERLQRRIREWVLQKLGGLFERMGRHPIAARALFWLILVGAVVWLALLVLRLWTRRARMERLIAPAPVPRQTWQEWMRGARLAAAGGDFRQAIHAAYWAGIVCLEASGALPQEASRTPRERLRQLAGRASDVEPESAARRQGSLAQLTRLLERAWYAQRPVAERDYLDSMELAEALGCKR